MRETVDYNMKVVIVGDGKVGYTLTKSLSEEEIEAAGGDDIQRKILTARNAAPMRADDIAREISENIDDILTALTELEIMGTVTAEGGVYRIS